MATLALAAWADALDAVERHGEAETEYVILSDRVVRLLTADLRAAARRPGIEDEGASR